MHTTIYIRFPTNEIITGYGQKEPDLMSMPRNVIQYEKFHRCTNLSFDIDCLMLLYTRKLIVCPLVMVLTF